MSYLADSFRAELLKIRTRGCVWVRTPGGWRRDYSPPNIRNATYILNLEIDRLDPPPKESKK